MALLNCAECGHVISTMANTCPGCGAVLSRESLRQPAGGGKMFAFMVAAGIMAVVLGGLYAISSRGDDAETKRRVKAAVEASKTPEQRAAEARAKAHKEAEFQFAVQAAARLKTKMNNPASFELVSAHLLDEGPLCIRFRGTNSFNAVVLQELSVRRDYTMGRWAVDCAGKQGVDMDLIRHAL